LIVCIRVFAPGRYKKIKDYLVAAIGTSSGEINDMKPLLSLLLFCALSTPLIAQQEENVIRELLQEQAAAWNRGDLQTFMEGYWKNDSLMFIGKSGVTMGWKATLDNYKKGYPDTAAMGKLQFEFVEFRKLSPDYVFVVGKWMLTRSIGNLKGMYTLLLQKLNDRWVIIRDHSS